jgi:hypothetical protein
MKNWEWRFGSTPSFTHHMETRFDWGIMDVNLNSNKVLISLPTSLGGLHELMLFSFGLLWLAARLIGYYN